MNIVLNFLIYANWTPRDGFDRKRTDHNRIIIFCFDKPVIGKPVQL